MEGTQLAEAMEDSGFSVPAPAQTAEGPHTYHAHQQLVEPLQFELRLGPHVWPQGSLQQGNAPARQHLPWRSCSVGVVVHLESHPLRPELHPDRVLVLVPWLSSLLPLLSHQTQLSHPGFRDTHRGPSSSWQRYPHSKWQLSVRWPEGRPEPCPAHCPPGTRH